MQYLDINLRKDHSNQPWGFRIQGGRDFNRPIVITRVTCNSVSDKLGLKCGDEIVEINGSPAVTGLTHHQAQQLIVQSGPQFEMKIKRASAPVHHDINQNHLMHMNNRFHNVKANPSNTYKARRGGGNDLQMSHTNFDLKLKVPTCHACNVVIRGPFVVALDYCFCPGHFLCNCCQIDLTKTGFIEYEGSFLCEQDYLAHLAPDCAKCGQKIVGDEILALNKKWHPHCFTCGKCRKQLGYTDFRIGDDDLPYCDKDWQELFHTKCSRCLQPITVMDQFVEVNNVMFHARCFCCSACKTSLAGKQYHNRNGKPFCKSHAYAAVLYE